MSQPGRGALDHLITRSSDRPIRFGIVGFGLHAVKRLMPGFRGSEHTMVTALSRRDAERARQSAAEYGIPQWFTSAAELCASPEVDAVFVTTPNSAHLNDVLVALEHQKPVLVEKPMGMTADECRRMIAAAERAGVLLGVAHVFRFHHSLARIRALILGGEIGQPLFARSEFSYNGLGHARQWIGSREISGGGPIVDVGVHCVDTLRFVLGQEVTRVEALAKFDEHCPEVEAAASLTLQFDRGALGVVLVSARAEYRTPIEIVGPNGAIRADDGLTVEHPVTIEVLRGGKVVHSEEVNNAGAYSRQVDAFALAVRGEQAFPATAEDGLRNQLVLDAAYRSIETGQTQNAG
jgi:1,5-anhydro-D-fructose reductase (1,5-anhydro-D-mannitol-forming)